MTVTSIDSVITAEHIDVESIQPLDATRVLADAEACAALGEFVALLRSIEYDGSPRFATSPAVAANRRAGTLVMLASGDPVRGRDVVDALGPEASFALVRCGALAETDGLLSLTARLLPMRSVYTFLPPPRLDRDVVYFGPDSLVLFEAVWGACAYGDRAADLATGNGFIAAALATRYDHVVAADVSRECVAITALIPIVNPHLRSRFSAVEMDVANGLRAGSFDLVTANAPWVPEVVRPDGPPRLFAAGGPTGFELPRRFIDAAIDLLAPGGRAFIACLDLAFDDGRRPLRDHLPSIEQRDVTARVVETRMNQAVDYGRWAVHKVAGATHAKHVLVEIQRT